MVIAPNSAAARFSGYDLDDDDDDGDGQVDVLCRYRWAGGTLTRDFNYNGAGWTDAAPVATGVDLFRLSYFGSPVLNPTLDGCLGAPDGIVNSAEILGCLGDGGVFDLPAELGAVASVRVEMTMSAGRIGVSTGSVSGVVDLSPPLLTVKRRW
jgi:hypothetical protein